MINSRVSRTGDGTHRNKKKFKNKESLNQIDVDHDSTSFWGYGDKEMTDEDRKKIHIIRKLHG